METVELPRHLELRRWQSSDDVAELTSLLHRAYAPLATRGLRFVATWQDDDVTKRRIADRECWVLVGGDLLIGTVTLTPPHLATGCEWYDRPDVATFGQFAVDPEHQSCGLGSALLVHVEQRAVAANAGELALDTAAPATDLVDWYTRRGYREVGRSDWGSTNYQSVVLSKTLPGLEPT